MSKTNENNTRGRNGSLLARLAGALLAVTLLCGVQADPLQAQDGSGDPVLEMLAYYHGIISADDLSTQSSEQYWGEECYYSYSGGQNSTYSQKSGGRSSNSTAASGLDLSGHSTTQNYGNYCYYSYGSGSSSTYSQKSSGDADKN